MEVSQKPTPTSQNTQTHKNPQTCPPIKRRRLSTKTQRTEEREQEQEEGVAEEKMAALQRIVPGGEALGADELFEETAGYIVALETRVVALRALTTFFEGLHKEDMKLGG